MTYLCKNQGMTQRSAWGEGELKQLGPRKFWLRWPVGIDPFTGKRIRDSITLNDITATQARAELRARLNGRSATTRLSLGELLDRCVLQLDVTERTRANYKNALKHIPPGARKWRAADITVTDAGTLINGLTARHGAATVRKAVGAIQSCWKQAYRNGWVPRDHNPWADQKLPDVTGSGQVLEQPEIEAVRMAALSGMEEAWIETMLATGCRPGEVVAVRQSDIDLDLSVVRFTDFKHDGRPRFVAIDSTTADVLAEWRETQATRCRTVEDPYMLSMDLEGAVPWRAEYASKYRWHALAGRANLRPRCDDDGYPLKPFKSELPLYSLRHTHNSLLAAAGVPTAVRSTRIGNNEQTNASTYTHQVAREDREAAAVIERRLGVRRR